MEVNNSYTFHHIVKKQLFHKSTILVISSITIYTRIINNVEKKLYVNKNTGICKLHITRSLTYDTVVLEFSFIRMTLYVTYVCTLVVEYLVIGLPSSM